MWGKKKQRRTGCLQWNELCTHETLADRATYAKPHQYAVGVKHVFVNGVQVLKDDEHTGAKPDGHCGGRAQQGDE
jgi:N-acyl-D-amino-acid deacylase